MRRHSPHRLVLLLLAASGCTSVMVQPLPPGFTEVVIEQPARDEVPGLLEFVRSVFAERGITTSVAATAPTDASTVRLYFESKVWDDANGIFRAQITLMQGERRIGYVGYVPEKSAWLSPTQALPIRAKLKRAFDALLGHYAHRGG